MKGSGGVWKSEILRTAAVYHCFNILPAHPPLLGDCLIQAITDVLFDEASLEMLQSCLESYDFLGAVLIDESTDFANSKELKTTT